LRSLFGLQEGVVVSMQPRPWPQIPEQTVLVAKAAFPKGSLAMAVRDELGEVFGDEQFAAAFAPRGAPAESPGALALVTALQYAENLTDRQAAQMVARAIDWKYALGLELTDPGFDHSVLSKFRSRLIAHGLEEKVLQTLLATLTAKGLLQAGGKQRTDSTHVISAVRDLNRLELTGESVRAAVEALAAAAPLWLAEVIDVPQWSHRYGARIDSWRLPAAQAKRDRLAVVYGSDALALLRAVYAAGSPPWLAELVAVQVLRTVLLQNYYLSTDARGREVVKRREADTEGLPPARVRITSPYDLDARWAAKGDELFWNGYKIHISESCTDAIEDDRERPNLITNVATTDATVPDVTMTTPIHQALAERALLPSEHYLDSGYPSADAIVAARREFGITLITPVLLDHSAQAKAKTGFDKSAFLIDWQARQATCPYGHTSTSWSPCLQRGREAIVVTFPTAACRPCPAGSQCTSARRRQLTLRPRELHEAVHAARAEQDTQPWQDKYALRAGVEGTVHQAVAITGIRHARYRGLPKTHLQHVYSAVALNLIRLDAWWNGHPLDRGRSGHLTRLDHALAA
jgi:transposase